MPSPVGLSKKHYQLSFTQHTKQNVANILLDNMGKKNIWTRDRKNLDI